MMAWKAHARISAIIAGPTSPTATNTATRTSIPPIGPSTAKAFDAATRWPPAACGAGCKQDLAQKSWESSVTRRFPGRQAGDVVCPDAPLRPLLHHGRELVSE